jgi:two-component system sensor histidine kinase ChvG
MVSPLTWRILAVNCIAPLLLAGGILYLDTYKHTLTVSELRSLKTQADLIASALGEGAVTTRPHLYEDPSSIVDSRLVLTHQLMPLPARNIVRRMALRSGLRVRLFDPNGFIMADSRAISGYGVLEETDLPPLDEDTNTSWFRQGYDFVIRHLFIDPTIPRYQERLDQTASDYDEVVNALEDGSADVMIRRLKDGRQLFSAAVPVQHYRHVLGAVFVSRPSDNLDQHLYELRVTLFIVFGMTLLVTATLSFYLSRAITRPLALLARGAERVRHGDGRRRDIPDLTTRKDEIGDLSLSLRNMTQTIWQRMDAIEQFAADVAHELKNPLSSLRSAVETVRIVKNPEQREKMLDIIEHDVIRLDRLISDISDASRLDAELSRKKGGPLDISALLATLQDIYSNAPPKPGQEDRNITITYSTDYSPCMVKGLESRLVQVFRNLIGNAITFSPVGGTIAIHLTANGTACKIVVEDEGPGIPEGKENKIFDRFYSERPKSEGFGNHSGLGLAISRQIIEAHNGVLFAENRHEGGARFVVKLPLNRAGDV